MPRASSPVAVIARKDLRDAARDRFILVVTIFMLVASITALTVAGIALRIQMTTYNEARNMLIALGKSVAAIAPPDASPLTLLRGFIEHVEIIGAVIGILIGYRAAANERGRQTLALIATRPVTTAQLLLGKIAGAAALVVLGLTGVFAAAVIAIYFISAVALGPEELLRLTIVLAAACLYTISFVLLGFILALWMANLSNALLAAFIIWLILVLVAPQIGDTLDPDNQVAGGVFKQLAIPKPQEIEILSSFSSYESLRGGIEAASPTKHFERLSFALLGIKDTYKGQALGPILTDKAGDIAWLFTSALALLTLLFTRRLDFTRLSKV